MFSGKLKQLWLIFLCLRWVSLIVSSIFQSFEHILYILYCVDSTKVSLCVFVCSGQAGRGGDRPLGRCRLQYLQSHRPLRLHAVSPYFYLLVDLCRDFCLFLTRHVFISVSLQRGRAAGPDGSRGKGKDGNVTSKMSFCPVDGDMSGLQVL